MLFGFAVQVSTEWEILWCFSLARSCGKRFHSTHGINNFWHKWEPSEHSRRNSFVLFILETVVILSLLISFVNIVMVCCCWTSVFGAYSNEEIKALCSNTQTGLWLERLWRNSPSAEHYSSCLRAWQVPLNPLHPTPHTHRYKTHFKNGKQQPILTYMIPIWIFNMFPLSLRWRSYLVHGFLLLLFFFFLYLLP